MPLPETDNERGSIFCLSNMVIAEVTAEYTFLYAFLTIPEKLPEM